MTEITAQAQPRAPAGDPRRGKPLTAAFVRTVSAAGKYHDGGGVGLLLRVEPTGSKRWVQRLKIGHRRREIGLGSPPVVTLAMAREAALTKPGAVHCSVWPRAFLGR